MSRERKAAVWPRLLIGLGLLATSAIVGAALGGLWVKLFVPRKAMGWDGLADVLGGLMVGALLGLVGGVLVAVFLSRRAQLLGIAAGLVTALLVFAGLALTGPRREPLPPPSVAKVFEPFLRIGLRVGHTREILAAVPAGKRPYPFTEAEVWTSTPPELVRVGWGPAFERCVATPAEHDLRALVPLIEEVMAVAGPYCRTPEDDLNLVVGWRLAGDTGGQGLDAGCLTQMPAVGALADAVGALADRLCEAVTEE